MYAFSLENGHDLKFVFFVRVRILRPYYFGQAPLTIYEYSSSLVKSCDSFSILFVLFRTSHPANSSTPEIIGRPSPHCDCKLFIGVRYIWCDQLRLGPRYRKQTLASF